MKDVMRVYQRNGHSIYTVDKSDSYKIKRRNYQFNAAMKGFSSALTKAAAIFESAESQLNTNKEGMR